MGKEIRTEPHWTRRIGASKQVGRMADPQPPCGAEGAKSHPLRQNYFVILARPRQIILIIWRVRHLSHYYG